ncbi:TPA: superoxide dismutase [Candidatus Berkelbacteria bacterium]|uniref:superoxide dismutase n=1 Tax=Berkelbacteria bacterium GW2011_GWE1_39_12 TaxID=1618337 RepID=A0A0G4B4N8_9BACT|nr:MAG: superoxide dismutase, superoxide dismutase, Fe-Mn family [Berkelbacteria bacterium GW2011_GWE1_39_12]HBO60336.1 superoxide dismutase [Candidatus Berkelbacteria bacterium]
MYKPKDYGQLLGHGVLSDELLNTHFKLYEGYVNNTNQMLELLDNIDPGTLEYSEIQRRFSWEWDGMRLHELYFDNLTEEEKDFNINSELGKKINEIYGDFETWRKNFLSVASMRGIGWTILYYDESSKELFNVWINEHDGGHFVGCKPILVIDCFEHAYFQDFGSKRPDYLEKIFSHIDWEKVTERF